MTNTKYRVNSLLKEERQVLKQNNYPSKIKFTVKLVKNPFNKSLHFLRLYGDMAVYYLY